jgi:hypothetical protein
MWKKIKKIFLIFNQNYKFPQCIVFWKNFKIKKNNSISNNYKKIN